MHRSSLNHSYRLIWSTIHSAFVAVAENVRGKGKSSTSSALDAQPVIAQQTKIVKFNAVALALALLSYGSLATAELPTGGNVVSGTATIDYAGNNLNINQTSNAVYSNWNTFNIGAANAVNIAQPSTNAVFLANILSPDVTRIQGQLNANGQVFLINPNGILFSPTAQINVGGLVASTLNLSREDFDAGNFKFSGASSNAIINQGNIIAANGGTVALIAAKITNTGTIVASAGNVLMGAGSNVTLDLGGPVKLQVTQSAIDALITNGGAIKADGGYIYLTASAANALATTVINNTGTIEAKTLTTGEKGEIYLMGDMQKGVVEVGGIIDASAPNGGGGGFIETSGAVVNIANDAVVTTNAEAGISGTWLIDPLDFYVAATGGNITGQSVSEALQNNGNFIIQTTNNSGTQNGDIFVNDAISWANNSQLTLNAYRNIEINQMISSTGTNGKLVLQYGQGSATSSNTAQYFINAKVNLANGQNFSTKLGNTANSGIKNYEVISNLSNLSLTTIDYALGADVATGTPLGNLTRSFEGLGHTITLNINQSNNDVGLFRTVASTGEIRNVVLSGSVTGNSNVGALVGTLNGGKVINSTSSVNVNSGNNQNNTGGLIGSNAGGTIINSSSTGNVTGGSNVGGLAGESKNSGANISNSYATGTVNGASNRDNTGGLIGSNQGGAVTNSYATGNITGGGNVGGLIGDNRNSGANISNSYATGTVNGASNRNNTGGLIGSNEGGAVTNSYAEGDVIGGNNVGGLVGSNKNSGANITDSYATGNVTGASNRTNAGGLLGINENGALVVNSYAEGDVNGNENVGGLIGYNKNSATVTSSYARGDVNATGAKTGGLIGFNENANILQSLATGDVTSTGSKVGGLVGESKNASISDSYASGNVKGLNQVGGLVGYAENGSIQKTYASGLIVATQSNSPMVGGIVGQRQNGTFTNNYYKDSSVQQTNTIGTAVINDADFMKAATFQGFDLTNIWFISEGNTSPFLRAFMGGEPTVINLGTYTRTYDGIAFTQGDIANLPNGAVISFTGTGIADPVFSVINAGEYVIVGPTSAAPVSQFGSYVQYISGSLTIAKREISLVNLTADNKVYDGNTNATFSHGSLSGVVSGELVTLGAVTGTFADKNANTGIAVTFDNAVLNYGDGVLASNYDFVEPVGVFSADIAKRNTTVSGITAGDKTYDGNTTAVVNFTSPTFSDLVDGETIVIDSVIGHFVNANAGNNKVVNLTNASYSGEDLRNYNVTDQVTTSADIDKASLTVIADNKSKTYGDSNPNFTISYLGFVNGEGASDLRGSVVAGNPLFLLNKFLDAGEYTIGLLPLLRSNNYDISYQTGTLTVNKAQVTVTGGTYANTYGDGLPTLGVTYTGFKNNQTHNTQGVIRSGSVSVSATGATAQPDAGTYVVDVEGNLNAKNYDFNYVDGSLKVNKALLTVTFDNQNVTYGDLFLPVYTDVTYGGFKYDQDYQSSDLKGSAVGLANAFLLSDAGNYAINRSRLASNLRSDNYDIQYVSGVLEIEKANLYIDVKDQTRQYGDANEAFKYTYSGFKNFQSARSLGLTGKVEYETDATQYSNVGEYKITATDATQALTLRNYNLIFAEGDLNIAQREITVTGNNASKDFGMSDPLFGYTVGGKGLVNGNMLAGNLSRVGGELPGNYLINGNSLFNSNYIITAFEPGALTIDGYQTTLTNAVTNAQNLTDEEPTEASETPINYVSADNLQTASGGGFEGADQQKGLNVYFFGNGINVPN